MDFKDFEKALRDLGIDVGGDAPEDETHLPSGDRVDLPPDVEPQDADLYDRVKTRVDHIMGHYENFPYGVMQFAEAAFRLLIAKRNGDDGLEKRQADFDEIQLAARRHLDHLDHLFEHLPELGTGEPGHFEVGDRVVFSRNLSKRELFDGGSDETVIPKGTVAKVVQIDMEEPEAQFQVLVELETGAHFWVSYRWFA